MSAAFPKLNFPEFIFRIRENESRPEIFDEVRKKWVALSPEEWVRQHVLRWLMEVKKYPASLLAVEKSIEVNGLSKRCDIVFFTRNLQPYLLVECKAPEVSVTQAVFDQAARYNLSLGAELFLITNGLNHYCCRSNHEEAVYDFLRELPEYQP